MSPARALVLGLLLAALVSGAARGAAPVFDAEFMQQQQQQAQPVVGPGAASTPQSYSVDDMLRSVPGVSDKITMGAATFAFPETVKIRDAASTITCTGVMVAWNAVLTAGHCSCAGNSFVVTFSNLTGNGLETAEGPTRGDPIRFLNYSCALVGTPQPGRDLALLKIDIDDDFKFHGHAIQHLDLRAKLSLGPPTLASIYAVYAAGGSKSLAAIGYGLTEQGVPATGRRIGYINIVSYFCSTGRVASSVCAPFREFALSNVVLSGAPMTDTCNGDSGGPIFATLPDAAGDPQPVLVGITSRGLAGVTELPGVSCGGGGIYTAIGHSDVLAWLKQNGVTVAFDK